MKSEKLQFKIKNWRKVKLREIADIKMGQSPASSFYNCHKEGLPFYQGVTDFSEKYPKKSVYCSAPIKIAEKGDILFSVRAPVGSVNVAIEKSCIGRGVASLKMKNDNNSFLYFLLKNYLKHFKGIAGGTTYESINKDQIEDIEISIPDDSIQQKRIAGVLSVLDDKIELNNKISAALEQMAQAIFKEWFVKFNFPVEFEVKSEKLKVKSLGYKDAGGKMVDSELGKIPEGWEMANLGDIADIQWGDTTKTKASYKNVGYPAYSASGSDGFLNYFDFNKTGVILGAIGANCGATWLAHDKWSCIKNTIRFWSKSEKASTEYLYLATKNSAIWPKRGSAQPFITLGDARDIKIIVPSKDMMDKIREYFEKAFISIEHNKLENQKLAALRDLLLPKLMSGEIKI